MAHSSTDYYRDVRSNTPMSMMSRPYTPGTPGTFDTVPKQGSPYMSDDYLNRYDDPRQARSPQLGGSPAAGTYYFDKEGGAAAGAGGAGAAAAAAQPRKNWIKRHPWIFGLLILILVVIIGVAAGVGGTLASQSSSKKNSDLSSNNGGSSSGSGSGSTDTSSGSTNTTSNEPKPIVPLPKWNQTDPNSKIIGVSLGNWLVLERWLDEDWFTNTAGTDAWDEYSFTQNLGQDAARAALQTHWDTWVVESDIETLKSAGINAVRIPIGYWALMPTIGNDPYVAQAGQMDRVQRVLGWLYDRGMYAMIDLHGMPGSQNGDQSSGHNTSNPTWFNQANLDYSYTVLNETIKWIQASNYSSVVQWICPVNEPRPDGDSQKQAKLNTFYEDSYHTIKNAGFIMQFHHAFESNPLSYWQSFATGKDPNYIVYNTNPYHGWFPPVSSSSTIMNLVCEDAQSTVGYPIPIVMTEYSLINGVSGSSFNSQYYNTQVSAWAWSGGAFFWTFKTKHSTLQVLAIADANMDEYSLLTLIQNGVVTKLTGTTPLAEIAALPNQQCGDIPTASWSNPSRGTGNYA